MKDAKPAICYWNAGIVHGNVIVAQHTITQWPSKLPCTGSQLFRIHSSFTLKMSKRIMNESVITAVCSRGMDSESSRDWFLTQESRVFLETLTPGTYYSLIVHWA